MSARLSWESWKPGLPKRWLFLFAGLVWACAGGILAVRGYVYVMEAFSPHAVRLELGFLGGLLFFILVFRRISGRHMRRIDGLLPERPCLFSFFNWRSYGMMALMIGMGIFLRRSHLVPADDLGTFYISMGIPLLFSSVRFAHRGMFLK